MQNRTILLVNGYGYESIGDFLSMNKIKTDYTVVSRFLNNIEVGDFIRLPLKHYDGNYEVYNIVRI